MSKETKNSEITFNYQNAFSRNLGWLNDLEQDKIKNLCIAIPGMGGVGGHHLHSLLRIGFEKFKIADLDTFEEHNFNRQIGARISSLGRSKVEVMKEMALDINPKAQIQIYKEGVHSKNYEDFLDGVDIVVDGLDIFVIQERVELFRIAAQKNIPVVTAAPLGMGSSTLFFDPKVYSFQDYFQFSDTESPESLLCKFLAGVAPLGKQMAYMKYPEYVDASLYKVPSLHVGVLAATSYIAATCTKYAIGRGDIIKAPHGLHYDFYLNSFSKFWIPFGNRNPIQKIKMAAIYRAIYSPKS